MYKKMVRIFKKIMYNMQDDGIYASKEAKGFVLECMVYNIPNNMIIQNGEIKYTLNLQIMMNYFIERSMTLWREVNRIKFLFGIEKGKDENFYKEFISAMRRYING